MNYNPLRFLPVARDSLIRRLVQTGAVHRILAEEVAHLHNEADREARHREPFSAQLLRPRVLEPDKRRVTVWDRRHEPHGRGVRQPGLVYGADGGFFLDTRTPFTAADIGSVTLSTTNKALYPVANFPFLGANYFGFLGKQIRIRMFGRITTAVTPGNGTMALNWGTGADNNGTAIVTSAAVALAASQTNLSWMAEFDVVCRVFGSAGALLGVGMAWWHNSLIAVGANNPMLIPLTAPANSGSLDLTAANIVSAQYLRSGSTAETMQLHTLQVIALN